MRSNHPNFKTKTAFYPSSHTVVGDGGMHMKKAMADAIARHLEDKKRLEKLKEI